MQEREEINLQNYDERDKEDKDGRVAKMMRHGRKDKSCDDRVATKLEIREIRKVSRKLKTAREIKEKSGNFAKFSGRLKFWAL